MWFGLLGSAGLAHKAGKQGGYTMAVCTQGAGKATFKVPDEMRNMAERSVTQARQALDGFLQAARRTTESMEQASDRVQAGAKDTAQKTLSAVEQNLLAS